MAKKSMLMRQRHREKAVKRFATKRAELKELIRNPKTSDDAKAEAQKQLQKLPRDANPIRLRNRCALTGRPHGTYRKFGLARTKLREATMRGDIPGLAQTARKPSVTLPASKQKLAVAKVLEQEGYLASVATDKVDGKDVMTLELKYYDDRPVIERIERVSRPGLRIFKSVDQLPVVQGGLGVAIVSTSQGVMTNVQARAKGHGGEVLCIVL